MAYNENTVQRIRGFLQHTGMDFYEKEMFRGICFMVDDKMCCAAHIDKASGANYLLCRIGDEAYAGALEKDYVIPMEFTGKSMKGYVYVIEDGFRSAKDLAYWLQLCVDFNPFAKRSKRK
ncbi:TfoX/Sxy family protein [Flavobacterium pallidum]|uniref:RNA methyltransferase n=1 Tax=Flavobacterium pallidum TaxID=2172098 RepID=A0A2S1SIR6_9FLAO|nr:TfoX/Sxy family protein [Flavobacterium pallidum]AWI26249.1 RNA methyltransferase [Flavobacterium pallidum]